MSEGRRDFEAPLTRSEVVKILSICSPEALLVGGQALAFWADYLEVALPHDLESGVTADIDFIGGSNVARELGRQLGWKTWIPSLDDATPLTGKVTERSSDGGVKQVDFLSGVAGLTTKDLERRAALVEVPDVGRLRVMHPIDVLDSRIQNLELLKEKRTKMGVAQARLAIQVARSYIEQQVAQVGERAGLKLLERVAEIARETSSVRVYLRHAIDPLEAVPLDAFRTTPALQSRRWPMVLRDVQERRGAARLLQRPAN